MSPISEYEFRELAKKAAGRLKRLTLIEINGPVITGSVESVSGLSDREFCVDFNDHGSVTGAYWMLYSENDDSYIPNRFADLMAGYIQDKRNV